jgi:hypothetical protein
VSVRESLTVARVAFVGVILFVAIQLVPMTRDNPEVEEEVAAPPAVRDILRRACYDCHSHETSWPWYSFVAPMSWLVVSDVHEAREHMNFSTWNDYDEDERSELLEEVWEEVEDGDMPLWFYLPLHPEAKLSDADKQLLQSWVGQMTED